MEWRVLIDHQYLYKEMDFISNIISQPGFNENDEAWKRFSKRLSYIKVDINSKEDWKNINNIPSCLFSVRKNKAPIITTNIPITDSTFG